MSFTELCILVPKFWIFHLEMISGIFNNGQKIILKFQLL